MTNKMQAAVVEQFGKPLVLQEWTSRRPGPARSWSRPKPAASATPISTPRTATGRSSRRCRSFPATRASGCVVGRGRGRHDRQGGRSRRRALALFGLRSLRILPDRLGDGVRRGGVRRLHQERRLRRVHPGRPELRRAHSRRSRPQGGRAAHLRRDHHLQGHQGDRGETGRVGRHLRRRRPRAPGDPVRQGRWACRSARSTSTTASSRTPSASAPIWSINAKTGDPAEAVKKATGGGAHGVLITAPSLPAFKQGVA